MDVVTFPDLEEENADEHHNPPTHSLLEFNACNDLTP